MDLFHNLKQLHKIEPDADYARFSRAKILMETPLEVVWYRRATATVWEALQSGSAIALTGILLFLALGGFSAVRFIHTSGGLNMQDLRAEAEAIDMQIQIADVKYNSVPPEVKEKGGTFKVAGFGTATSTPTSSVAVATSSAADVGDLIDDALLQLANP